MARDSRNPGGSQEGAAPLVKGSREAVRERILSRVEIGKGLMARPVVSAPALEELTREYYVWDEYNVELLKSVFTTSKFASEYVRSAVSIALGAEGIAGALRSLRSNINDRLRRLQSIAERLDLIEGASPAAASKAAFGSASVARTSNKVFVVHGRDEQMRDAVARFLQRLGFDPVILAEQPNRGRTIIEKFEQEADVGFAVVLLSPDDVGGLAGDDMSLQERARQNVILELGYFVGRLGRERVCTLKKGDLELPTDFVGVAYTPFSSEEGWKLKLAMELRAAEYEVDLNRL